MINDLATVKAHIRVISTDEDTLIQLYSNAAEDSIKQYLDTPGIPVNASVKAAHLLITGDLYENRESQFLGTNTSFKVAENPAVTRLLFPYRKNLGI